jgi:hypothetical protein
VREFTQWPALGETAARESFVFVLFRLLQTNAVSTVPAGNPSRRGYPFGSHATPEPRRRDGLPLAAMSEKQGKKELQPR